MPLGFGRNFQGMLATVPGASRPFRPHSEFFNSQDSLSSNVNGQSRLANNVMIEGIDNDQKTGLLSVIIPSAEALETVSVTTSNYDAEFGRAGGAVTNATIKSGTNQFRGSGFWFGDSEETRRPMPSSIARCPRIGRSRDALQPVRLHLRRADHEEQAVLLRRLRPDQRRSRARQPLRPADRGAARRQLQRVVGAIYDPLTGDPATGANREAFPGNVDPGQPDQPDRAEDSRQHPAAEPPGRGARAGQLPGHDDPRAPDGRLRREDQLPGVVQGSGVGPLQLHAPDGPSQGTSRTTSAGPTRTASSAPA